MPIVDPVDVNYICSCIVVLVAAVVEELVNYCCVLVVYLAISMVTLHWAHGLPRVTSSVG